MSIGPVLALSVSAAVVMLGFGIVMPFLPVYAQLLGAGSALDIGILSSAFLITRTFLATPAGSFSDRLGRRRVIMAGLALYALTSVLFASASSWVELIAYRAMQGIASAMVWPAATALVADITAPDKRGTAMGIFNSVSMSGWMIGPALGGAIQWYSRNAAGMDLLESFKVPFYASALLSVVSMFLVLSFVKVKVSAATKKRLFEVPLKEVDPKFRRTVYVLLLLLLSYGFATSFVEPMLVYFVQHEYGLSEDLVVSNMAVIFTISGVVMLCTQLIGGRIADNFSKKKTILYTSVFAQALTMLMPFSRGVNEIGYVMVARSAFYGMGSPAYTAFQQNLLPTKVRGALTGLFDTAFGVGAFAGPLVGFLLYDMVSHSSPFLASGMLGVFTLVAIVIFTYEPKEEEVPL
ncbi:MAG: MFS transporter [Candidatus Verstraetearchaeota archaeon]|nr:MFS transporter [Candidatus Verstraetearchaeota archaeon]